MDRARWCAMARWMALCTLAFAAVPARARSISITDFDAAIAVDMAGLLDVTETIRLRFDGQWNGIYRLVPEEYRDSHGAVYRLRIVVREVTDTRGSALRWSRTREGVHAALKIHVPGAADAERTITIHYTVARGLRFFPDHDELYWNVTGDEWPYPIAAARARITLPGQLVNLRANGFTGSEGSRERAVTITIDGAAHTPDDAFAPDAEAPPAVTGNHVVEVTATRALGIREGLTAAVAWNPGVIRRPTLLATWWAWLVDNVGSLGTGLILVGAPIVALVGMLLRWLAVGRDPRTGPVVVQYEPPIGLGPAEVGTLVDNRPDPRDLMAMIVDCAVKGVVRVRETAPAGWLTQAAYAFDLMLPESAWPDLPAGERALLRALFPAGTTAAPGSGQPVASVTTASLTDSFHVHLPGIRDTIFDTLVKGGHYRQRPDHVRDAYVGSAVVAAVVVGMAAVGLNRVAGRLPFDMVVGFAILSAIVTAVIIAGFGLVMPSRTAKGATARAAILGFEEFLTRVEAHRLASLPLTPELFERYLPYAMALGVEGRWAKAFEGICSAPPSWYAGTGPVTNFQPGAFTQQLGQMGTVTGAAMQSAPRSSSGSAFGGAVGDGGDECVRAGRPGDLAIEGPRAVEDPDALRFHRGPNFGDRSVRGADDDEVRSGGGGHGLVAAALQVHLVGANEADDGRKKLRKRHSKRHL
ncbi:MAG: DUF2207 domain-containing protein [Planctomycetia bacterium]|nr:DUF2207 domain-containing protein [Planctomycetia bacterium]